MDSAHPPSSRRGQVPLQLLVVSGADSGRRHRVEPPATIGRGEDADIIIDDAQVSRAHACIAYEDGRLVLKDLESRNGTAVGDIALDPGQTVPLPLNEQINLGARVGIVVSEQEPIQDEALRRQRLETSGKLASSVARDLGDKLCAAMASLDVLRTMPDATTLSDDDVRACLDDLVTSLGSSVEMLPQLFTLDLRKPNRNVRSDLSRIVRDIGALAARSFMPEVAVRTRLEAGLIVKGDSAELYHAVMQMCLVLREAIGDRRGRMFLGARKKHLSRFDQRRGRVVVTIRADAEGLAGTKLDDAELTSVREVVTLHGGRFKVMAEADTIGCHFELALVDAPRMRLGTVASFAPFGGRERGPVLVVHDEQVVQRALSRVLDAASVVALTASSQEVIGGQVDMSAIKAAVIDDEAAGAEVVAAVLAHVGSGQVALLGGRGRPSTGLRYFIRQPWTSDTVLQAVDRMLESSG